MMGSLLSPCKCDWISENPVKSRPPPKRPNRDWIPENPVTFLGPGQNNPVTLLGRETEIPSHFWARETKSRHTFGPGKTNPVTICSLAGQLLSHSDVWPETAGHNHARPGIRRLPNHVQTVIIGHCVRMLSDDVFAWLRCLCLVCRFLTQMPQDLGHGAPRSLPGPGPGD